MHKQTFNCVPLHYNQLDKLLKKKLWKVTKTLTVEPADADSYVNVTVNYS